VKVTKDMLDLAKHIVNQKAADFEPEKFEDHYEDALTELINAKRNGKTIAGNRARAGRTSSTLWPPSRGAFPTRPDRYPKPKGLARPPLARRKCCYRSPASAALKRRARKQRSLTDRRKAG
jgi:DNA end-binding protein Ku